MKVACQKKKHFPLNYLTCEINKLAGRLISILIFAKCITTYSEYGKRKEVSYLNNGFHVLTNKFFLNNFDN